MGVDAHKPHQRHVLKFEDVDVRSLTQDGQSLEKAFFQQVLVESV
jgi:hypothetical protein